MATTLEVRWFRKSTPPSEVRNWIDTLDPNPLRTWTDVYLPSSDTGLNVKVRDDKLQIKRRTAGPTPHTFTAEITGHLERWTKWSFELADTDTDPRAHEAGRHWIAVRKRRRRCCLTPEDPGPIGDRLQPEWDATVYVELTTLSTESHGAWTLCVEVEGPSETLIDAFAQAGPKLLNANVPIPLPEEDSYGYVRWLENLPDPDADSADSISLPSPE